MRERIKDILIFENEYCSFRPWDWITIEGIKRPVIFKVVTDNYQSLGLKRNRNIMTFPPGEWVILNEDSIVPGKGDWGGIWCACNRSTANEIKKYMWNEKGIDTQVFLTVVERPVYANKDRVKSGGVMLIGDAITTLAKEKK